MTKTKTAAAAADIRPFAVYGFKSTKRGIEGWARYGNRRVRTTPYTTRAAALHQLRALAATAKLQLAWLSE